MLRTKGGHAMKYASRLLAVLLVAGLFGTPMLYADGGGDLGGQRVDEQTGEILVVDRGGDYSGQPIEEAHDLPLNLALPQRTQAQRRLQSQLFYLSL
jgi:hypothetical protein